MDYKGDKDVVNDDISMMVAFDHEEIGSETYVGANSEYLKSLLLRIVSGLKIDGQNLQ